MKFRQSALAAVLGVLVLGGCEDSEPIVTLTDPPAPDTGLEAPPPPDSEVTAPGIRIDPASIKEDDTLGPWRVVSAEVQPSPDRPGAYTGVVRLAAQVTLSGRYQAHPGYPEVDQLCFLVDHSAAEKLPRFPTDERKNWFCFSNQEEARKRLDSTPATGLATIVIDDFRYEYSQTDVFNTAKLVDVVEKRADVAAAK